MFIQATFQSSGEPGTRDGIFYCLHDSGCYGGRSCLFFSLPKNLREKGLHGDLQ